MEHREDSTQEDDVTDSKSAVDRPQTPAKAWPLGLLDNYTEASEETKLSRSAFQRLPAEIIEQYVRLTASVALSTYLLIIQSASQADATP